MGSKLPPSIDFSLPPPGFSTPPPPQPFNSRQLPPPNKGDPKSQSVKRELNSIQPGPHNASRNAFYQGSNIQPDFSRSVGQPNMGMPHMAGSPGMPMGAGSLVNMALPPPPINKAYPPPVSPVQMGLPMQNNMYPFVMPSTPPPLIGAGQYPTKKPGNYQPQQQGDFNRGYDKRNGYYPNLNRKRNGSRENDNVKKLPKKKKKPLSQNLPTRKEWTTEEAEQALAVEREYNKLHKNPSLIIKFPDLEVNRDIVTSFHPLIESVHFQQPSTPRFCFVTLSDSSRIKEVIDSLNKTKFGLGLLSAEPKNTKDEDSVKGPEDIDPLTLYVGNLAQEVTVDDVVRAYPKHKRIDIGFAKKMKYTRYAFVGFRTVSDAIEAFQKTHSTEMYNKSLIVRFRRLHGTVGLPGDAKQGGLKKGADGKIPREGPECEMAVEISVTEDGLSLDLPEEGESEDVKNVLVKQEGSQETDSSPHLPLAAPKTEPVDFLPEVKQENPDVDEEDDFMNTFVDMDDDDDEYPWQSSKQNQKY